MSQKGWGGGTRLAGRAWVAAAGLTLALGAPADGQETVPMLPSIAAYDWTSWLVGTWEGWLEDAEGNRVRQVQTFEPDVDGRYLVTRLRQEVAPDNWYTGTGLFRYDPVRGEATGEWFGIVGDRNQGLARRDGERMVWDIDRRERGRVLRIRERLGPDEYRMTNRSVGPDGGARVTTETMRRVTHPTVAAAWRMPAGYRAKQVESLEAQRAFLHAMADSMPEAAYATVDNEGQRTFAQHGYHAAVALAAALDRFLPGPAYVPPDEAAATASRAALRGAIDGAFDHVLGLLHALPDAAWQADAPFAGRSIPVWQLIDELEEHTFWTLGEMVGNFRALGMPPPLFRFH